MSKPSAAVIVFPGSNGDRDMWEAFERAGFAAHYHPAATKLLPGWAAVGLPGGFSYGDYWRAGMLASQAPAVLSLPELVAHGTLVLGVCNGFQILVEAGVLPGALQTNEPAGFLHRWVSVKVTGAPSSPWFYGVAPNTTLRLPIAHGEGNYFHPVGAGAVAPHVPLRYAQNPNGSLDDIAGLTDDTGQVLGIMPHPERAISPLLGSDDGLTLFAAAHRWLSERRDA